jgi:hypothetical protein
MSQSPCSSISRTPCGPRLSSTSFLLQRPMNLPSSCLILKADWHDQIANQIQDDVLIGCLSPAATIISDVLARGFYLITSSTTTSCLRPIALCGMLTVLLATSTSCTISVCPCPMIVPAFSFHSRVTTPTTTLLIVASLIAPFDCCEIDSSVGISVDPTPVNAPHQQIYSVQQQIPAAPVVHATPHNNGAPTTLGTPPVAAPLSFIVVAITTTSFPPAVPQHSDRCEGNWMCLLRVSKARQ